MSCDSHMTCYITTSISDTIFLLAPPFLVVLPLYFVTIINNNNIFIVFTKIIYIEYKYRIVDRVPDNSH